MPAVTIECAAGSAAETGWLCFGEGGGEGEEICVLPLSGIEPLVARRAV